MVVGDDIAILSQHEAGAGGGGGGGLPKDVDGGGGHSDAHAGGQVGGVELLGGHDLARGGGIDHSGHLGPVHFLHDDRILLAAQIAVIEGRPADPGGTACQHAGQHQSYRPSGAALPLLLPGPQRALRAETGLGVAKILAAELPVLIVVVKKIVVAVFHTMRSFQVLWILTFVSLS